MGFITSPRRQLQLDSNPILLENFMFNLQNVDGEMRIYDLELAERLEFAELRAIRKIIKRNETKLLSFGTRSTLSRVTVTGQPFVEYYLNQKQAIFICMKSETDKAFDVQADIVRVYDQIVNGTYRPKSHIQDVIEGMKRNEVKLLGFDQLSVNDRKDQKALQWEIQQTLGLTPKKMMKRRIDMRAPLNLLINGISSGEFRRRIGLQNNHRDLNSRPMKTVDFLPEANQYALFRTDLLLFEFLRVNNFNIDYAEACTWYLRYGEIAKGEAERKYSVNLHEVVNDSLLDILGFVAEQVESDVSPYAIVGKQIQRLESKSQMASYQN